jgi:DNA helicase II / ATP-dependent DNA helicase PcrA
MAARWRLPLTAAAAAGDRIPELRPNLREALQAVAALLAGLRERWGQADPATALERVIAATDYERHLADEGADGVDRLENVQELVAGAAEWAELAVAGNGSGADEPATLLERYLTQVALVTPADGGAEAPSGVTLMTVHMAKGLEWSLVALTGLEDGLFPLGRSVGVPGGLEEERRLCYVGLTRARERLYLSWARTRYRSGRLELSEPSRFLESVPGRVIEEKSTSVRWDRTARGRPPVARAGDVSWDEDPSQDAPRYASGERVRHRKFGAGVVRAVAGSGRALKVTVEFDAPDIGTKQLLVAYAGLEREWESA